MVYSIFLKSFNISELSYFIRGILKIVDKITDCFSTVITSEPRFFLYIVVLLCDDIIIKKDDFRSKFDLYQSVEQYGYT